MHANSEAALISRIRAGNEAAFRELFDAYIDRLVDFANSLIDDRPAAQDIVADVFLALWRTRANWRPERIATYMFGAVRNRCYNHHSSKIARREVALESV